MNNYVIDGTEGPVSVISNLEDISVYSPPLVNITTNPTPLVDYNFPYTTDNNYIPPTLDSFEDLKKIGITVEPYRQYDAWKESDMLTILLAVAGYQKEQIEVTSSGDIILVKLQPLDFDDDKLSINKVYLNHDLTSEEIITITITLHRMNYDTSSMTVCKMGNGLLKFELLRKYTKHKKYEIMEIN